MCERSCTLSKDLRSNLDPFFTEEITWGHALLEKGEQFDIFLSYHGDRAHPQIRCELRGVWKNDRDFLETLEKVEIDSHQLGSTGGFSINRPSSQQNFDWAGRIWSEYNLIVVFPFEPPPSIEHYDIQITRFFDVPDKE